MIESVDKLRELPVFGAVSVDGDLNATNHRMVCATKEEILEIADEIEEEFALYSLRNYPEPFGLPEAMHMVLGTAANNFDTPEEAVGYMNGETSMSLPVDSDDVPIRVGDKLEYCGLTFDAFSVTEDVVFRKCDFKSGRYTVDVYDHSDVRHVKPDTLKELLDDVSKGIICYPRERVTGYLEDNYSIGEAVMLDVRDRLRELLGGDAE